MKISFIKEDDFGIIRLEGELKNLNVKEFKQHVDLIVASPCPYMIIDLSWARLLSTSALGFVFSLKNRLEDADMLTAIVGPLDSLSSAWPDASQGAHIILQPTVGKAKLTLRKIAFDSSRAKKK